MKKNYNEERCTSKEREEKHFLPSRSYSQSNVEIRGEMSSRRMRLSESDDESETNSRSSENTADDLLRGLVRSAANSAHSETASHKLVTLLQAHPRLKDREDPVRWLTNLKMIAADRDWSSKKFRKFLPRLWNVNSSISISNWFKRRRRTTSLVTLERDFLRKYAPGGLTRLANEINDSRQEEGQSCEDFLQQVENDREMLERWDKEMVSQESHFVRTLETRFVDENMIELLHEMFGEYEKGERLRVTIHDIRTACRKADRPRMFGLKEKTAVLRVKNKETGGIGADVRRIVDSQSHATEEQDREDALDEFMAMSELFDMRGRASSKDIHRVMMARRGTRPVAVREQGEYPEPGLNVVNGPQSKRHVCHQEHVCPFYSLLRRCTLSQGKCRHAHKNRSSAMCRGALKGECNHGAFCAYRHPKDEYQIWFYDWKKRVYKLYMWKDYFSPFSSLKR